MKSETGQVAANFEKNSVCKSFEDRDNSTRRTGISIDRRRSICEAVFHSIHHYQELSRKDMTAFPGPFPESLAV